MLEVLGQDFSAALFDWALAIQADKPFSLLGGDREKLFANGYCQRLNAPMFGCGQIWVEVFQPLQASD